MELSMHMSLSKRNMDQVLTWLDKAQENRQTFLSNLSQARINVMGSLLLSRHMNHAPSHTHADLFMLPHIETLVI